MRRFAIRNTRSAKRASHCVSPRNRWRQGLITLLTLAGVTAGLLSLQPQRPRLIWNMSPSVPLGLYAIYQARPDRGDLIAIAPEGALRALVGLYSAKSDRRLLIKQVAAVSGDKVCRHQMAVTINEVLVATAQSRAPDGRKLPVWTGCRVLAATDVLVLTSHAASFDSRYFGPIDASQIVGVARPVLTIPQAPEREA